MNKKLPLIILFLFALNSFSQVGFEEHAISGESFTTRSPQLVRAADVDGDGDLDIVVYGREMNWYENIDGVGNFGKKNSIQGLNLYGNGTSLFVYDFDGDGDVDILSSILNKFSMYENINGAGTYNLKQEVTLGPSDYEIVVYPVDVNNDGYADILCNYTSNLSGPFEGKLVFYQNDGSGNLSSQQIITTDTSLLAGSSIIYCSDLDGDSLQDIIIGSKDFDSLKWLKNNGGSGTFNLPITITNLADGLTSIYTSDIDNDGFMDIVSASANDNQVAWHKNLDGLGNFGGENLITSNAIETKAVLVTDINNDNSLDIIYTSTNEIGWINNTNGLGSFGTQQIITTKAYGVEDIISADLDGDGIKDLISASYDDNKVAWYKNDGNGNLGRQVVIARRIEFPQTAFPGDFDGDNDIDILVSSQDDGKLTWFENVNGLGFFGKEHVITENIESGAYAPTTYPADIDGDGDLDIITMKNSQLFWYENTDGGGNFDVEHLINSSSFGVTLIRAGDMDGDGAIDIICGSYSSNNISWYKNLNASETFSAEIIIVDTEDDNGSLTSLEIADMDGDNDLDIIASSYLLDTYYYKNINGLGNFVEQYMEVFELMQSVYPADMDGDGDKDIVGVKVNGSAAFGAVEWYENVSGNFTVLKPISGLTLHGNKIHAADIDGDGDVDVLTASETPTSGQIAWYENNGIGVFSPRKMIQELFNNSVGQYVTTADIDNDNDQDVIAIFSAYGGILEKNKVSFFKNLGALGNTIAGKILVDTNGDGCSETDFKGSNLLVSASNGPNIFSTFTNENGNYTLATNAGNFTAAITSQLPTYYNSNPVSYNANFVGLNSNYLGNFCVAPVGQINDLKITVYPSINDLRPGFDTSYRIVYKNIGTTTLDGTVDFEYNNSKLNFLNADQIILSQTANKLTFNFVNLKPLEIKMIDLNFIVFASPITNINDQISSTVTINPTSGDATEVDNVFSLNQTVIGSYDPNNITCLEGNQVLIQDADEFLHYIIRFQNTGTASAINVKVVNILDQKLDWTSMQLESMSHNGRVELKDGNELKFIFENIYLNDSLTDEPNSHGFIAYKIKPLSTVTVGNIIENTANIYFDFNPPIITNTASTEIVETLSIVQVDAAQFTIHPNPTENILNINGKNLIDKVVVVDINGRIVKEFFYDTPTLATQLDITELNSGIYFLKITSNQISITKKIIKK
jgi:uncharacterized repeat protein (TIGR01451 family)